MFAVNPKFGKRFAIQKRMRYSFRFYDGPTNRENKLANYS